MAKRFEKRQSLILSFKYAFQGLLYALSSQRNIWIHFSMTSIAIMGGLFFKISHLEWMALLISCTLGIVIELINTAIELSVDLTTKRKKYRAMLSKDVAAAAVLLSAINATAIGYLIFYKRLVTLFSGGL